MRHLANSPLVMVDQYVPSLKRYGAIAMDLGDADGLAAQNRDLDAALTRLGVPHTFQVYEGDHGNRVAARFKRRRDGVGRQNARVRELRSPRWA